MVALYLQGHSGHQLGHFICLEGLSMRVVINDMTQDGRSSSLDMTSSSHVKDVWIIDNENLAFNNAFCIITERKRYTLKYACRREIDLVGMNYHSKRAMLGTTTFQRTFVHVFLSSAALPNGKLETKLKSTFQIILI